MKVNLKNNVQNRKNRKKKKTRMAVVNTASKKEYKPPKKHSNIPKNEQESNGILAKAIITVVIAIFAILLIFVSGAFNISEIIVEENKKISDEQIISFSGIEKGTNLFAVSEKDIKNKLKENSYINNVKIKRVLPNKIKLIVGERKLEYVLQLANSYVYIDRQGFILEISNTKPEVPVILGFSTDLSNVKSNDRLNDDDLKKINTVIKIMKTAVNHDIANLITKIDVSNEKNYTIYLDTEGKIAYLGDGSDLNTRFLYVKSILKEQQGKNGEIFVNMNLNSEYVYFRENV